MRLKKSKYQKISSFFFQNNISEHRTGIASTINQTCGTSRQYKFPSNFQLPIHIPDKTKYQYGDIYYEASKRYDLNFWRIFEMYLIGGSGM